MNVTQMFGLTVASMGKFIQDEGTHTYEYFDPTAFRYIKILFKEEVPVGGNVDPEQLAKEFHLKLDHGKKLVLSL